jgi:hypothetical protein
MFEERMNENMREERQSFELLLYEPFNGHFISVYWWSST